MDGESIITAIFLTLFIAFGFAIGQQTQANHCHKTLNDGRRYVAIRENNESAYYILGEKLSEKPSRTWEVK